MLPECVRKAVSSIIPTMQKSELASLGLHEKLFLLGVARFFKESEKAYASLSRRLRRLTQLSAKNMTKQAE